ncbi:MAG TPA: ArsA-related P-loop ATPase [Thermodesulfobacteriota bacterium]|nr:ArsA-related P-loop ATPase [Thermodesulfobacteriota bacterium]
MTDLARLLTDKRIVVSIGPGGVGKTTISSLLALEAASRGRRTLALTMDPSRRLAQSLGVRPDAEFGRVTERRMREAGFAPEAELTVRLLDSRATFDALVMKTAPSEDATRTILSNNYYKSVASSLAGVHEYMAGEALLTSFEEGTYDLVILDTPPAEHLSGFLSAPSRLGAILDSSGFKSFVMMDRLSFGFTKLFTSVSLRFVEKIVGIDVLHDMWEFFSGFECVGEGMKARARKTDELLKSPDAAFVIVTSLREASIRNAASWRGELAEGGYDVGGVVVNRVLFPEKRRPAGRLPGGFSGRKELAQKLEANYRLYEGIADAERDALGRLRREFDFAAVPDAGSDIAALSDLHGLRKYLF